MTTKYVLKRCASFGFARSLTDFREKYHKDTVVYVLSSNKDYKTDDRFIMIRSAEELGKIGDKKDCTILLDLECDYFNDIHISRPEITNNESSSEHVVSKDELQNQLRGKSTQLDAFSNNLFAIVYGKKSANLQAVSSKQNHQVLDSLARNGVVCTPKTSEVLSIQKIIDYLLKFENFSIFGVHSALDIAFDEQEYPSEISHPSYIIGKGEIVAIFYRYVLINFFGYCSIVTDSMRENAYIF